MMSLFSKAMDHHVDGQFRRDPNGRLAFLPFGKKGKAYFVDSQSDEEKIRSFVKLYRSVAALITLLIYPVIYVPGGIIAWFGGAISLRNKLKADIGVGLFSMLLALTFLWMLWSVYKETVQGMTASLSEVGPEVKDQLRAASPPPQRLRLALVCFGTALIVMGIAIFAATRYSRPKVVCPPKDATTSAVTHP